MWRQLPKMLKLVRMFLGRRGVWIEGYHSANIFCFFNCRTDPNEITNNEVVFFLVCSEAVGGKVARVRRYLYTCPLHYAK
jgi:hypothetical protein